jgi:hypothetical protein
MATPMASSKKNTSSALAKLLLGAVLIAFWLVATLLQIQTNESFILHGATVSFRPDWSILRQPVGLMMGTLDVNTAKATLFGWGIELVFLIFIVGYEIAHEAVRSNNKHLAGWFQTATIVIVGFDVYTDYLYGNLASGFWGQVLFAAMVGLIVLFFGIIGLRFLEHGITELTH